MNDMKPLTGTLEINDNKRYHLIYSSQAYQTHFNIFADFHVENYMVLSGNFQLVNYKGPINIGLKKIGQIEIVSNGSTFYFLPITIQGLLDNDFIENHPFNASFKLNPNTTNYLVIIRDVVKLNEDRGHKTEKSTFKEFDDCLYNCVFDSEYYLRDGIGRKALAVQSKLPSVTKKDIMDEFDPALLGAFRCMYSVSKIV